MSTLYRNNRIARLELDATTVQLFPGGKAQLQARAKDAAGNVLTGGCQPQWVSSDVAVASVDASGMVTANREGRTSVAAVCASVTAAAAVEVIAKPVAAVAVQLQQSVEVDEVVTATVRLTAADGEVLANRPVTWRTSNPNIAVVSSDGSLLGVAPGDVELIASVGNVQGAAAVRVDPALVATIELSADTLRLASGDSTKVLATLRSRTGRVLNGTVAWESSDTSVAEVAGDGVVAATDPGLALVSAKSNGKSATAAVLVENPAPVIMSVSPDVLPAGAAGAVLTVLGSGFTRSTTAYWNGALRSVTFVSTRQLQVTLGAADLATVSVATLRLQNPAPGGGTSNVASIPITSTVQSVRLAPLTPIAALGSTLQFTATPLDASLNPVPGRPVTWQTSNVSVAPITNTGLATAVGIGTATITATVDGRSASTVMTVAAGTISVPTLTAISPTSAVAGTPGITLSVSGSGFTNSTVVRWNGADRPTTFVSAAELRAAVAAADLVNAGTAAVTVYAPTTGTSVAQLFTITAPSTTTVARVVLLPASDTLRSLGATRQFTVQAYSANGSLVPGAGMQWNSSNAAVATVDQAGIVTARNVGTALIIATALCCSAADTTTLAVVQTPAAMTSAGSGQTAAPGAALPAPISVTVLDAAGSAVPGVTVQWAVTAGGGSLSASSTVTNASGSASVQWTLGSVTGTQSVRATVPGVSPITFIATAQATAPVVARVQIAPSGLTFNAVGDTARLTATALTSSGTTVPGTAFSWTTSNSAIATVDATGKVTARGAGAALIIAAATCCAVSDTVTATVNASAPTAPAQVTGLSATAVSSSQINLSWSAASGATGYSVYRGTTLLRNVTTTSTTDSGLQPGTPYTYTVQAFNATGANGPMSAPATATTLQITGSVVCEAIAPARCFYMSPNGSSSGSGSFTAPFRNYSQAHAVLRVGDYLYYRGGVYTDPASFINYDTNLTGAAGQRITIKSYPNERAIFDGSGTAGSLAVLRGQGAIIEGFEFRNSNGTAAIPAGGLDGWTPGIAIWGGYHTFRRNWIHDVTGDPVDNNGSMRIQGGTNNEIHNNAFERLWQPANMNGSAWNVSHIIAFQGGGNKIHSNYFSHAEDRGQGCMTQKHPASYSVVNEVYNNTFDRCSSSGFQLSGSDYRLHHNLFIESTINFDMNGADHAVFEYNTVYSSSASLILGNGVPHTFRRNLLYQTASAYVPGNGGYTVRYAHYGSDAAYATAAAADVWEFNCYYNPSQSIRINYFGGAPTTTGGVYSLAQFQSVLRKDLTSIEANPQLVNIAGRDFRTAAGSPCAGMGAYAGGSYSPPLTPSAARGW